MSTFPQPLPKDTLERLVEQYRTFGDDIICRKCMRPCEHLPDTLISHLLVESHLRLAAHYAGKDDELQSHLFLSLFELIQKARNKLYDNNLSAFVAKGMRFAIFKYRRTRGLVKVPPSSWKRGKKGPESTNYDPYLLTEDYLPIVELKDEITHLIHDEQESNVLTLLLKGYTQDEVASELKISRQSVVRTLKGLRTRYVAHSGSKPGRRIDTMQVG